MTEYLLPAADLVAIALLIFGVYFPRHRRRDLVTAFMAVNVGVLAVAVALSTSAASVGFGLGLFGVLSIIRLRSAELEQTEIAYYFSALALGLLGGLGAASDGLAIGLMALIVVAMFFADSPRLFRSYRQQLMVLDLAITDELALIAHLEQLLGAKVQRVSVHKVDLVNDSTVVDVRYTLSAAASKSAMAAPDDLIKSRP